MEKKNSSTPDDLLTVKKTLEILTWVSRGGLYSGAKGTTALNRYEKNGKIAFSEAECWRFKADMISTGRKMVKP